MFIRLCNYGENENDEFYVEKLCPQYGAGAVAEYGLTNNERFNYTRCLCLTTHHTTTKNALNT